MPNGYIQPFSLILKIYPRDQDRGPGRGPSPKRDVLVLARGQFDDC
jgi:hypothetical protein